MHARRGLRAALLLFLGLGSGGCGDPPGPKPGGLAPGPEPAAWEAVVVLEATAKIGGVAAGDVDPRHPGPEVVAVTAAGEVWVAHRAGEGWTAERAAQMPGEMIQVAVGDADPTRAGLEIVAVGMANGPEDGGGPGAAWLVAWTGDAWTQTLLFEDERLVHGVAVLPGAVVVVGFSTHATRLARAAEGWQARRLAELGAPGKIAIPFGAGVAVGCADGSVWVLDPETEGGARRLFQAPAGQSRLGTDGERLLCAGDDGRLRLWRPGAGERLDTLHAEERKLRGAVLADLDPATPGLEAATAGYGGRVTLLAPGPGGAFTARTIHTEGEALHHLALAEVDPAGPGPELLACGFRRRVVLLRRR